MIKPKKCAVVGIYKIISPTGKVYIGQSWDIYRRWKEYKTTTRIRGKLLCSIKKYGATSHIFITIHELPYDITQEILDIYEIIYINQFKDCGIELLNLKAGGSHGKHSQESKLKMSLQRTGLNRSLSAIIKTRLKNKGRKISDYQKNAIRKAQARFTDDQAIIIRNLYDNKIYNSYQLSSIFGVSKTSIMNIINRKTYKHL